MPQGNGKSKGGRLSAVSSDIDVKIAWLYHVESLTQEEIGRRLNISRMKVMRSLAASAAEHVVVTTINSPMAEQVALERELEKRWQLDNAVVVPDPTAEENLEKSIGHAVAQYLEARMRDGMTLAIGGGATLHASLAFLPRRSLKGASVVGLVGSLSHSDWINPSIVAVKVAERFGAVSYQINAPVVVDGADLCERLWAQPSLGDVRRRAAKADIALVTAGEISPAATIFRYGIVSPELIRPLEKAGAVANVLCQFIDGDGRLIAHGINRRVMAMELPAVARLPHVVLAAGGAHKVPAILAALRAVQADVVITNAATARLMLETASHEAAGAPRSSPAKARNIGSAAE